MTPARVPLDLVGTAMGVLLACGPTDGAAERDCSESDLPPPLCHRAVVVGSTADSTHYQLGVLREVRDGVRPVLGMSAYPFRLTLFDPLDMARVLIDVPGPFLETSNASRATFGDFDGDGADEIALRVLDPTFDWNLVVLDGRTLETRAIHQLGREETPLVLEPLDLQADGADELLTVTPSDVGLWVGVWKLQHAELVEARAVAVDIDCTPHGLRGDFDGDSHHDVVLAWDEPCASDSLLVLRGGSGDPTMPLIEEYPQPKPLAGVVAADIDGDRDHEVVVFHTSSTMTVMDWSQDGLTELDALTLDIDYVADDNFVQASVGKESGRPDWLIVSDYEEGAPSDEWFDAVVFPGRPETPFIPLEHRAGSVADYDDDGLSDFRVVIGDDLVVYLSLP